MKYAQERLAIWMILFVIALCCGLPINHTTLFWVSFVSLWIWRDNQE